MIVRRHRGLVPRRKGDLLALPGVGPALVAILVNVYDSWETDDGAAETVEAADRCCAGGGSSGATCGYGGAHSGADADADADAGGVDTDVDGKEAHGSEAKVWGEDVVKVEEQPDQAGCRVGVGVVDGDGCGGGVGGGKGGEMAATRRSAD